MTHRGPFQPLPFCDSVTGFGPLIFFLAEQQLYHQIQVLKLIRVGLYDLQSLFQPK